MKTGLQSKSARRDAQLVMLVLIGVCSGFWWVPVLGGVLCSFAVDQEIGRIFRCFNIVLSPSDRHQIFWFFRRKTLFLNLSTYLSYLGPLVQVLEVYLAGMFVLRCVDLPSIDIACLEQQWIVIEEQITSGHNLVGELERFVERPLHPRLKTALMLTADKLSSLYCSIQNVPGMRDGQAIVGQKIEKVAGWVWGTTRAALTTLNTID